MGGVMGRLALTVLLVPVAATAQSPELGISEAPIQREIALTCTFTTECMDTEGCADTAYSVKIEGQAGGTSEDSLVVGANMISDAETVAVIGTLQDGTLRLTAPDPAMPQLLTSTADGARLTAHIASATLAITYAGTCE